ncbi:MAG: hemolysin family protein [Chryseolinea sp.]
MSPLLFSVIIVSLTFSFFFSAVESVYQSTNKLQLELEGRLGSTVAKILSFFTRHPAWLLGTSLVGSTVSLVVFTVFLSIGLVPILHHYMPLTKDSTALLFTMQSVAAAFIILPFSTFLPKALSVVNPNRVYSFLATPFFLSFVVLFPLTITIISLNRFIIVRMLKMKFDESNPFIGAPDVRQYQLVHQPPDESDDIVLDKKIFHNALSFKTVKIRDCMIPRTEITAVELNDSIEKLRIAFVESGHSKVIVYKQSIDEIIGYCHSSSIFKRPEEIREILTPIIIAAENSSANELMIRFIKERRSLAVVIDEFGGTSGIVSMEDIIEEIFGDIEDEHDQEDTQIEERVDDKTWLLSARLDIDYLNETYGLNFPTGEYETLGGLILALTEDFPDRGQVIELPPYTFIIQAAGNNRIETVSVHLDSSANLLA